jgi:hypothetical protein
MDRLSFLISKLNEEFSHNATPDDLLAIVAEIQTLIQQRKITTDKGSLSPRVSVVMPATSSNRVAHSSEPVPVSRQIPQTESSSKPIFSTSREVNEVILSPSSSVNDLLKKEVVEVGHILKETPIRDLRKAIGINDRFVFVNDLFMGDEEAFEETLKTINSFRIFGEAIFWIEKEVAKPLGWREEQDSVRNFLQLVRRRFL